MLRIVLRDFLIFLMYVFYIYIYIYFPLYIYIYILFFYVCIFFILKTIVNGWINSPGHRKNLLSLSNVCGIAVYKYVFLCLKVYRFFFIIFIKEIKMGIGILPNY